MVLSSEIHRGMAFKMEGTERNVNQQNVLSGRLVQVEDVEKK